MMVRDEILGTWELDEVMSPHLDHAASVVIAETFPPYLPNANRLQNLSSYLPKPSETSRLVGTSVTSLPNLNAQSFPPQYLMTLRLGPPSAVGHVGW